jgi:hypothetical protein
MSHSMGPRPEELAWAAGLFDGEGSTSTYIPKDRKSPRRQMAVSQGGAPGELPAVLVRLRKIVQVGNVTGPYDGLYYWKVTKKDEVDSVGALLWPYLSSEKRIQIRDAARVMRRPVPESADLLEHESAWAAGLFDGEGTFGAYQSARMRPSWRGVSMSVPQASATIVPDPLIRFRAAVGVGR